ncbi:MAG: patatin-like phospholipase RssA [Thiobacillus sp.]|nr:patatin-like phospholipase RssA [Thiobacillus sp.]
MNASSSANRPRVGLALGGGAARGWAHIGVIRALTEAGIEPDLVCGTSIGALVGAAYAGGELDRLEDWVRSLRFQTVVSFLDVSLSGGLIKGDKLIAFFRQHFLERDIAELERPFAAVATDLYRGREIWLREGGVSEAVRASIALPGLFTPVLHEGAWLVDGGLVNPVPVSLCRAMGADIVIAVDLNTGLLGRHLQPLPDDNAAPPVATDIGMPNDGVMARIQAQILKMGLNRARGTPSPAMIDVLASSINIMQVLITRSRLAGDPADVTIAPRLANLGLMEFHRGVTAIEAGREAVEVMLPHIRTRLRDG